MWLTLAIFTALLILVATRLLFRDWASPVGIYLWMWAGAVGLLFLGFVSYHEVSPTTWGAVALSGAAFLAGTVLATAWMLPLPRPAQPPMAVLALDRGRFEKLMWLLLLLGTLGLLLQMRHLHSVMGLSTLIENPVKARELHENVRFWGYFNILNVVNVVLAVLYLCRYRVPRLWMPPLFVVALVSALITTDRTRFFYMAIWALCAWWYASGGMRLTCRKLLLTLLTLAVLLGFFVLIGNHYQRQYHERYATYMQFPAGTAFLADPYIYFTGSLPALDAMLADGSPLYLGRFSFSPLVSLLKLFLPGLEPVDLKGTLYHVPMEINTFSYLHQFYLDFGWFGILLGPFFCGLLSGWVYMVMRKRPSFFAIYTASLLAYCCAISTFVNMFTQEATWFFVLVGWLVDRYLGSHRGKEEPSNGTQPATHRARL